MGDVVYRPNIGRGSGIENVGRSPGMRRYMQGVAEGAGAVARRHVRFPAMVTVSTEMRGNRWRAIITNGSRLAVWEEYGSQGRPGTHPLGKVLDAVAAADPNRRRGRRITRG